MTTATETPYKRGDTLPNGATVIDLEPAMALPGVVEYFIVLASWVKRGRVEYVTWMMRHDGACCIGNYFTTLAAAATNFQKRLIR